MLILLECFRVKRTVKFLSNQEAQASNIQDDRPPRELAVGREIEKGFSEASAYTEAQRCLQCGLICYLHDGNRQHAAG